MIARQDIQRSREWCEEFPDLLVLCLGRVVGKIAYLLAWRGKVFDQESGDLLNIVSPFGVKAIRALVYKNPSWIDQRECIVIDYSKTSFVARLVRDEIREVSPGVFLGQVFWSKTNILKFALVFSSLAASLLRSAGYDARNVRGGMAAWRGAGLPVTRPKEAAPV